MKLVLPRLRLSRPALALALVGVFVGLAGFWIVARIDRAKALSGMPSRAKGVFLKPLTKIFTPQL